MRELAAVGLMSFAFLTLFGVGSQCDHRGSVRARQHLTDCDEWSTKADVGDVADFGV